jgi:hypothetical protein
MTLSVRSVGVAILFLAVAGLIWTGLAPVVRSNDVPGALPACAMVLLMVGLTLVKPSLVMSKDDAEQVSAMRIAVLLIIGVFVLLTVKTSWSLSAKDGDVLKVDNSWVWIVIAALGGKAAQSFSETFGGSGSKQQTPAAPADTTAAVNAPTKTDSTHGPSPSGRPKTA